MKTTNKKSFRKIVFSTVLLAAAGMVGCQSTMRTMGMGPPMGSSADIADADRLWSALESAKLVGAGAKKATPYTGMPPHGAILETLHQEITVDGHRAIAIVKRNYGGPGVSIDGVNADRGKYLKAVTVMYKRERGYDADNKDWFWAKYTPDGGLHVKEKMGMKIALVGRVAKGKPEGCISCHRGAPGGDYIFAEKIRLQ